MVLRLITRVDLLFKLKRPREGTETMQLLGNLPSFGFKLKRPREGTETVTPTAYPNLICHLN